MSACHADRKKGVERPIRDEGRAREKNTKNGYLLDIFFIEEADIFFDQEMQCLNITALTVTSRILRMGWASAGVGRNATELGLEWRCAHIVLRGCRQKERRELRRDTALGSRIVQWPRFVHGAECWPKM
ncbi:hypothetical protein C8J57DRAFT_1229684 [Mycena rebaudengoi]|nr:hypothetical protein C8J57DRAFT_1229684 [Mycena rebaudengoi]